MNPYREPSKPTMSRRLRQFFVDRKIGPGTAFLAAVLIAGITIAATPSLRINQVKFPDSSNAMRAIDVKAPEYGAKGDGSTDDSTAINAALTAASPGMTVYLPATSSGYNIATTTINIPTGVYLVGAGRNATSLRYTGTGCAVKMATVAHGGLQQFAIFTSNAAAGVRGVCLDNITSDTKFNTISDLQVISTAGYPPTVGSIGVFFDGSGGGTHALYYNRLDHVEIGGYDKGIRMLGSVGSTNGPNANIFTDVMVFASAHGVSLEAYANESTFFSFFCSASGYTGTDCVVLGDGVNPTSYNAFYGVTSDQGAGPRTATINAAAVNNYLQINSQSSGTVSDSGTGSMILDLSTGRWLGTTLVSALSSSGSVLVATGQLFDSYNASSTVGICTVNATTCNYGKTAAAWTQNAILQAALPAKPGSLASASTIAPTLPITHITGTTNISTITAPTNFAQTGGGGCFDFIFDSVGGTWDAIGNILTAGAPSYVGQDIRFCYDQSAAKYYPTSTNTTTAGTGTATGSSPITLFKSAAAVGSLTSGEIDGQTYTIPANTLNTDGQMITFESEFVHAANTNSTTYQTYFAGASRLALISNVSAQLSSTTMRIVRTSSSTARIYILSNTGTGSTVGNVILALTGLNFAATNIIKNTITGATTNGDLTAVYGRVEWWP